jgi:hypothetical protein
VSEGAAHWVWRNPQFNADDHPELAAILRTGNLTPYRRAVLFCARGKDRVAEIFRSPAGPILRGHGNLMVSVGDQYGPGYVVRYLDYVVRGRRYPVVRYLDREPVGAVVSVQCRCSEHLLPLDWLAEQRGHVARQPRQPTQRSALR